MAPFALGRRPCGSAMAVALAAASLLAMAVLQPSCAPPAGTRRPVHWRPLSPRRMTPPRPYAHAMRGRWTLEIPRLGIRTPVKEGLSPRTLARAVGHYPGAAVPGQPGTAAFAGHRSTHTRPFRHLGELRRGDVIHLISDDAVFDYRTVGLAIVRPRASHPADIFARRNPTPTLLLTTCTPPGWSKARLVAWARLAAVRPRTARSP